MIATVAYGSEYWHIVGMEAYGKTHNIELDNGTIWTIQSDNWDTTDRWVWVRGYFGNKYNFTTSQFGIVWNQGYAKNSTETKRVLNGTAPIDFQIGDPVKFLGFEVEKLRLADKTGKHEIWCTIREIHPNITRIKEIDYDGDRVYLSDGTDWEFSWWQTWTTWNWKVGDPVCPYFAGDKVVNLNMLFEGGQLSCVWAHANPSS